MVLSMHGQAINSVHLHLKVNHRLKIIIYSIKLIPFYNYSVFKAVEEVDHQLNNFFKKLTEKGLDKTVIYFINTKCRLYAVEPYTQMNRQ